MDFVLGKKRADLDKVVEIKANVLFETWDAKTSPQPYRDDDVWVYSVNSLIFFLALKNESREIQTNNHCV